MKYNRIWDLQNDIKHHSKLKTENLTNIITLELKNDQKWPKHHVFLAATEIMVKTFLGGMFLSFIYIFSKEKEHLRTNFTEPP